MDNNLTAMTAAAAAAAAAGAGPGMLSLSLRPLNEDTQQLACRWRGCALGNQLFCPQTLYDHLCQEHASSSYAALGIGQDAIHYSSETGELRTGSIDIGEGVACLWEGCQYRCKSKKRHHMNSHLRSHVPLSPFQCHMCGVTFKWKSDLTKHLRRQHNIAGPNATSLPLGLGDDMSIDAMSIKSDDMDMSLHHTAGGYNAGMMSAQDLVQLQNSREQSIAVLQQFIQAVREGRLQPTPNNPDIAMWSEALSKLDLAAIKPLLVSNPEAVQIIESFLDGMNAAPGRASAADLSTSPATLSLTDSLGFLAQTNDHPVAATDDPNTAPSSLAFADRLVGGVPLTAPLGSMGGLFAMDQPGFYSAAPAYPTAGIPAPGTPDLTTAAASLPNAAAPAMLNGLPVYQYSQQYSPQQMHTAAAQPAVQRHHALMHQRSLPQLSASSSLSSMSPISGDGALFGTPVSSSPYAAYSPPVKIEEEPISLSSTPPTSGVPLHNASPVDMSQYNWMMSPEYHMGIESAMGVQPSEIFGHAGQSPIIGADGSITHPAGMMSWTNRFAQSNGADERSLRRVQSTPMLVDQSGGGGGGVRQGMRVSGSPSMLRPMRSTELRTRMVSPSRSTDRPARPHQATKASLLRASQSVDALRMQATLAAVSAANQGMPTGNGHLLMPDTATMPMTAFSPPHHPQQPGMHPAAMATAAAGFSTDPSQMATSPVSAGLTLDNQHPTNRAQLDKVLRRMQHMTLRNPSGAPGQVKFKRSLERIRWQGQ